MVGEKLRLELPEPLSVADTVTLPVAEPLAVRATTLGVIEVLGESVMVEKEVGEGVAALDTVRVPEDRAEGRTEAVTEAVRVLAGEGVMVGVEAKEAVVA